MTAMWAARLSRSEVGALAPCRQIRDVEVAASESDIWLKGTEIEVAELSKIVSIPTVERFLIVGDGQLVPVGKLLPTAKLPTLNWRPLRDWLMPRLPVPGFAGRQFRKGQLSLEPSSREQTPNVIVTKMAEWTSYVDQIAQVRLERWKFAVCADGRVAVWGEPLPSIPGLRLHEESGVAIPIGQECRPPIDRRDVALYFDFEQGDLILWHRSDAFERIRSDQFCDATRSSVRMSGLKGRDVSA